MPGLARRDRFDFSEPFRRFIEGEWEASPIRVEEFTEGDTYVVRAEMPGIDPEKDVDVSVADGVLRIKAEREEKKEHKAKGEYRSEFRYGSFVRNIPLPKETEDQDISATYRDGVLEIRVPVAENTVTSSTKVPITRG